MQDSGKTLKISADISHTALWEESPEGLSEEKLKHILNDASRGKTEKTRQSEDELAELIQKIPEDVRKKVSLSVQYSGPLPPAAQYEKYEQTFSGSADRILKIG